MPQSHQTLEQLISAEESSDVWLANTITPRKYMTTAAIEIWALLKKQEISVYTPTISESPTPHVYLYTRLFMMFFIHAIFCRCIFESHSFNHFAQHDQHTFQTAAS